MQRSSDETAWENACKRVGVRTCEGGSQDVLNTCLHGYREPHYPSLGDAATVVAMLEWLVPHGGVLEIDRGSRGWSCDGFDHAISYPSIGLALAHAICALPEDR